MQRVSIDQSKLMIKSLVNGGKDVLVKWGEIKDKYIMKNHY